jgi:hypothetical protein
MLALDQRFAAAIRSDQHNLVYRPVEPAAFGNTGLSLFEAQVISERPPIALDIVESLATLDHQPGGQGSVFDGFEVAPTGSLAAGPESLSDLFPGGPVGLGQFDHLGPAAL